jgi:prephenate dehydrogenase
MKERGKITLLGMGLLGGSLGLAIQARRLAKTVTGYVRNEARIKEYASLNLADELTCDLAAAVRNADWIILCVPVEQMAPLLHQAKPYIKPGAIITDVGSVKLSVELALSPIAEEAQAFFVGSHPMAGSEKTGPLHADVDLFNGATCVITPTDKSDSKAVDAIAAFWRDAGCEISFLAPKTHDRLVARSSHLPHVVSAALVNYVLSPSLRDQEDQSGLCSTGFKDTTRIASGAPVMWREIVMANRDEISVSLSVLIEDLKEFQESLSRNEGESVLEFFNRAKSLRDDWLKSNKRFQETKKPS